ncbi:MAG: glycosyltransferase family 39 protein [Verrucomicrobia bacterium]|nr:glycosyltransferase family 39 protein [Verrucomicrobiota bacterium]
MPQADSDQRPPWWFLPFVLLLFLGLLGTRSLNEPDEGRYAEIAREMVETGNWLVPHIWYVPHLDKPPFTYWAVAASLSVFGVNEWAVRLPLALAGLSAAWATFLLIRSIAGAAAARWAVLLLSTSTLYWVMARMLTTDIFLTQFIAWAIYFFWQSWRSLDGIEEQSAVSGQQSAGGSQESGEEDPAADAQGLAARRSFGWQLAAWAAMAGGALTKGPIALVIPLVAFGALLWWRCKRIPKSGAEDFTLVPFGGLLWWRSGTADARLSILLFGTLAGVTLFVALALPWFLMVWETVPNSFEFMVKGQIVGHAVQAAVKNRAQPFWFFLPVLAVGFLPWTLLLGWLWRRAHWRSMDARTQEAWLVLSVWAGFTFVLFSVNSAKLMHYILPMFPALAALVALRWPAVFGAPAHDPAGSSTVPPHAKSEAGPQAWLWRALPAAALLPLIAFPIACWFVFKVHDHLWVKVTPLAATMLLGAVVWESRKWSVTLCTRWACGLATLALLAVVALTPLVEADLRSNQTLKPLGLALKREFREGDMIIVRHRIPQGLPFYAHPVISAERRPWLSGLPEHRMPFEFPGNRARFGDRVLKDDSIFSNLLAGQRRVLVVGFKGSFTSSRPLARGKPLRLLAQVGDWELFTNQ